MLGFGFLDFWSDELRKWEGLIAEAWEPTSQTIVYHEGISGLDICSQPLRRSYQCPILLIFFQLARGLDADKVKFHGCRDAGTTLLSRYITDACATVLILCISLWGGIFWGFETSQTELPTLLASEFTHFAFGKLLPTPYSICICSFCESGSEEANKK